MSEIAPVFALKNARLSFGSRVLFENANIYVGRNDKICLIGRNGSGKSTLLKVIAGQIECDEASYFAEPNLRISLMPQEENFNGFASLRDVVLSGLDKTDVNAGYKADILIETFQLKADLKPETASGGERKKAALAKALISEPDLLLLDEPTNHLDIETVEKLEKLILNMKGAVIVISHDRRFLSRVSNACLWLDRGTARRSNKGYACFEEWQEQIIEQEIIACKYLNKRLEEETKWLHQGVTARRKRNLGRLRRLAQLRAERKEQLSPAGSVKMQADKGMIQSKMIIEAKNISKSFGDKEIIKSFSTRILRGNKIGIVGPNGAGKSTLIKLLTKRLEPDSGAVRLAKNLEEGYFDQGRLTLDITKTLWRTLCPEGDHLFVRGAWRHVVSYLKDFLFTSDQAQMPVSALSGGEKNRLMLAVLLARPSNFLVLDEPTNDLDTDTLDLLQEVLADYDGTVLIVSHDRDFLDKTVTSLIYMPGDGTVQEYAGGYAQLEAVKADKKPSVPAPIKKTSEKKKENPVTNTPRKLNFTEAHLLKELPNKIAEQTKIVEAVNQELNDPRVYQDKEKLLEATNRLHTAQTALEVLENKWLELELLAEEGS